MQFGQSAYQYGQDFMAQPGAAKKGGVIILVVVIILLVLIVGGVALYFLFRKKEGQIGDDCENDDGCATGLECDPLASKCAVPIPPIVPPTFTGATTTPTTTTPTTTATIPTGTTATTSTTNTGTMPTTTGTPTQQQTEFDPVSLWTNRWDDGHTCKERCESPGLGGWFSAAEPSQRDGMCECVTNKFPSKVMAMKYARDKVSRGAGDRLKDLWPCPHQGYWEEDKDGPYGTGDQKDCVAGWKSLTDALPVYEPVRAAL